MILKISKKNLHKGSIDPFVLTIVAITIVVLAGIVFLGSKSGAKPKVTKDEQVKLTVGSKSHDWGDIDIQGGIVSKTFDIKNDGDDPLKLYDIKTSCTCTTAQVIVGDKKSKKFGMHEKTSVVVEVPPHQTAQLRVEFDPAFHGPDAVGQITRAVTLKTNDPINPDLVFQLAGNVVKNK